MKFLIKDFVSKYDQIRSFLRIWSHLWKKSLMENFIYCAVFLVSSVHKTAYMEQLCFCQIQFIRKSSQKLCEMKLTKMKIFSKENCLRNWKSLINSEQICSFLRICWHLLTKLSTENFTFCAVSHSIYFHTCMMMVIKKKDSWKEKLQIQRISFIWWFNTKSSLAIS